LASLAAKKPALRSFASFLSYIDASSSSRHVSPRRATSFEKLRNPSTEEKEEGEGGGMTSSPSWMRGNCCCGTLDICKDGNGDVEEEGGGMLQQQLEEVDRQFAASRKADDADKIFA
jgi:hypothetical protein